MEFISQVFLFHLINDIPLNAIWRQFQGINYYSRIKSQFTHVRSNENRAINAI